MKNIYLVGFAGCGKSSLGKTIAAKLGYRFVDLDTLFEQRYGPISDFFVQKGEDSFRKIETTLLHETAIMNNVLVATGGGTPCFGDNMQYIKQNGVAVYLSLPAKVLADRLKNSRKQRPLVNKDNILQYVQQTLSARELFYKQATLEIAVLNVNADKLVERIKEIL